jgi:hypothetical protein
MQAEFGAAAAARQGADEVLVILPEKQKSTQYKFHVPFIFSR